MTSAVYVISQYFFQLSDANFKDDYTSKTEYLIWHYDISLRLRNESWGIT